MIGCGASDGVVEEQDAGMGESGNVACGAYSPAG